MTEVLKQKVALDLGGSGVRVKHGEDGVNFLVSQHTEIKPEARVFETIHDKLSDFLIKDAPYQPIVGRRYARGEAQEFHSGIKAQVDNQSLKVDQDSTYVNAAHGLASHVYNLIKDGHEGPIELTVGVAIPTSEFYSDATDRVKERLTGKYTIEFKILGKQVEFTVTNSYVFPEGVVALLMMAASKHGSLLKSKTGIIIDGGRRSTDVTVVREMKVNARSARSLALGGITLEANVAAELEKAGYMPSPYGITKAIAEGVISEGSNEVQVGKYVETAKSYLATDINEKLRNVYASAGISVNELNYVVYIGRCFDTAGEVGEGNFTGDLGNMVIDAMGIDIVRIDVDNLETANVDAVFSALQRIK